MSTTEKDYLDFGYHTVSTQISIQVVEHMLPESDTAPDGRDSANVYLSNLSYGAIWEAFSFTLNRSTGSIFSNRKRPSAGAADDGEGAYVVTWEKNGLSRRMLAIYLVADEWMLFDGVQEFPLQGVAVTWTRHIPLFPGFISLATLTLRREGGSTSITYFRPTLRYFFERWWSFDDIDMGHNIFTLSHDSAMLARFGATRKSSAPRAGQSQQASTE